MSYVVFGTFNFRGPMNEVMLKDTAFQIVERGLAEKLHVQLGCNITHAAPFLEMLGLSSSSPSDQLLFLVTDSPISDTSDELISPYHVGLDDRPSLQLNLAMIHRFLRSLKGVSDIVSIDLFFTEGFDIGFERKELEVEEFCEAALQIFGPAPEIPSTHFAISLRTP